MKTALELHNLAQRLWLDDMSRDLLTSGTPRDIKDLSLTGLTPNPTSFDHAIENSTADDPAFREKLDRVDVRAAADLFRPVADHYLESVNGQVRGIGGR